MNKSESFKFEYILAINDSQLYIIDSICHDANFPSHLNAKCRLHWQGRDWDCEREGFDWKEGFGWKESITFVDRTGGTDISWIEIANVLTY